MSHDGSTDDARTSDRVGQYVGRVMCTSVDVNRLEAVMGLRAWLTNETLRDSVISRDDVAWAANLKMRRREVPA
jgi:hypothetical protein